MSCQGVDPSQGPKRFNTDFIPPQGYVKTDYRIAYLDIREMVSDYYLECEVKLYWTQDQDIILEELFQLSPVVDGNTEISWTGTHLTYKR